MKCAAPSRVRHPAAPPLGGTRPVHDDANPGEANDAAHYVREIRAVAVDQPAPQQRQDNEDPAVGGVHPAEVRGLQCGEYAVREEDETTEDAEPDTSMVAKPKPDEIATTYLTETGEHEQRNRE